MESFSLLKYWRGGGRGGLATSVSLPTPRSCHASATLGDTVLRCGGDDAPVNYYGEEDQGDDCSSSSSSVAGDDEGPFFDLEFAVPDDEEDVLVESEDGGDVERSEEEFGFAVEASATTLSDGSAAGGLSPSRDDLFFKGRLVPLETTTSTQAGAGTTTTSLVLAEPKNQFLPVSTLLKSATRFRVFALGLKKGAGGNQNSNGVTKVSTAEPAAGTNSAAPSPKHPHQSSNTTTTTSSTSNKFFTVKYLKVVEEVPIMSLFSRDSSSRSNTSSSATKAAAAGRQSSSSVNVDSSVNSFCVGAGAASTSSEDKKFSKELVHKYLNKIKPLYVRVSRRHADKLEQQQHQRTSMVQQQQVKAPTTFPTADGVDSSVKELLESSGLVTAPAGVEDQKPQPALPAVVVPMPDAKSEKQQQQQLVVLPAGTANCKPPPTQKDKAMSVSVSASAATASQHIQAGLRVVCKHLGKSRSASSAAVAAAPSPPPSHAAAVVARRRDDSLLQQQDGIQSAIAHCKRSFNATRADDTTTTTSDPASLPRSRSDSFDDQRCGLTTEVVVAPPHSIS